MLFQTSSLEQLPEHLFCHIFSLQVQAMSSNFASIGFVLQIMLFDTVHTFVNRYSMPDFAKFIKKKRKRKHFLAAWFTNPFILHEKTKLLSLMVLTHE